MSLSEDRVQILSLATGLRPPQMLERLEYWRKGAGATAMSEMVKKSRSTTIPTLDALDRRIQLAQRSYIDCISDAARLLVTAAALEKAWLWKIDVAPADLQDIVSDSTSCMCSNTRELWERENRRTPWRIKRGLGPCCYSSWTAEGQPDIQVWLRARRSQETSA